MDGVVDDVGRRVAAEGFRLRKAFPRGPDRLLLQLEDSRGKVHAGQWHLDADRTEFVARRTRAVGGVDSVVVLHDVLVQRGGVDRRLPTLAQLVAAPGAVLVAHRAERRGVVRRADGDYTKVVPPHKVTWVAEAFLNQSHPVSITVPHVTDVDYALGTVTTKALPGRTLHERLADYTLADDDLADDARAVGAALREFHQDPAATTSHVHDVAAEVAGTEQWLRPAADYGLLPRERWQRALYHAAVLLADRPAPGVRVHRDLHDKQLVLATGHPVGLLDLDLSSAGEPAVDLANLLAHLELRTLQGHCSGSRSEACSWALLSGYAPSTQTLERLPGYLATARLRLAGVYAFRLADPSLVDELLRPSYEKELM